MKVYHSHVILGLCRDTTSRCAAAALSCMQLELYIAAQHLILLTQSTMQDCQPHH